MCREMNRTATFSHHDERPVIPIHADTDTAQGTRQSMALEGSFNFIRLQTLSNPGLRMHFCLGGGDVCKHDATYTCAVKSEPELASYPPATAYTPDPVCVGEFTDNKWFIAQFERASKLLPLLLQVEKLAQSKHWIRLHGG